MRKRATHIPHWIKATAGLAVAWLLLLLPAHANETLSLSERQTFLSSASAQGWTYEFDFSPAVYSHESIALVSPRAGFSFLSSPGFLACLGSAFSRTLHIAISGRLVSSFFCFSFLRSLFEHQIAINAP